MTVRYDPHSEWAREEPLTALDRARQAVDRLANRRDEGCRPGASCLDRTDGYLCDTHYEQETRAADFGGGAGFDDEVDLPW